MAFSVWYVDFFSIFWHFLLTKGQNQATTADHVHKKYFLAIHEEFVEGYPKNRARKQGKTWTLKWHFFAPSQAWFIGQNINTCTRERSDETSSILSDQILSISKWRNIFSTTTITKYSFLVSLTSFAFPSNLKGKLWWTHYNYCMPKLIQTCKKP